MTVDRLLRREAVIHWRTFRRAQRAARLQALRRRAAVCAMHQEGSCPDS